MATPPPHNAARPLSVEPKGARKQESARAASAVSGPALAQSDLALPGLRRGKVRDVYDLPAGFASLPPGPAGERDVPALLLVATDRISAFDVVMPDPVPGKGRILTALSLFWLRLIEQRGICSTHLLGAEQERLADRAFKAGGTTRADLAGRITLCRKTRVIPIECVVRGYLEGSGWKEYQASGSVCGVKLPGGLAQCAKLPQPIFTPATKEEGGKHDENVSFERACELVGKPLMERLRELSLAIYTMAAEHARARGIIIADTKFEFGIPLESLQGDAQRAAGASRDADPILIDEALTPDSSRFWPAATYAPGRAQQSFDKQFLREYLEGLVAKGQWAKAPPGPRLPASVLDATMQKYDEALRLLTGPATQSTTP